MTFEEWKNSVQYFKYKNHSIAYWTAGKGPPLLLIHGFPTSSWDWHKTWVKLTNKFTVYAVDMIGFGYSDKPRDYSYSLTDQARLHETFLKHVNIKSAHLLVHDYGVSVAQEMLASAKERNGNGFQPQSCCFLNGGLFPHLHHARPIQKILNSPFGFLVNALLSKESLRKSFDTVYGNTKASEQEIDWFYQLILYNGGKKITHKLMRYITDRKTNADRWKSALTKSSIPLHFINGPLDPVSGGHLAKYCQQLFPQWKVDVLNGVGHYPHDEAPDKVLSSYFNFVNNSLHLNVSLY
jgi:pimeloyl-ACP methyl ester carboxylesterase